MIFVADDDARSPPSSQPRRTAATLRHPRRRRRASSASAGPSQSQPTSATTGTRKCAPIAARTTFGAKASARPAMVVTTASQPAAAAVADQRADIAWVAHAIEDEDKTRRAHRTVASSLRGRSTTARTPCGVSVSASDRITADVNGDDARRARHRARDRAPISVSALAQQLRTEDTCRTVRARSSASRTRRTPSMRNAPCSRRPFRRCRERIATIVGF